MFYFFALIKYIIVWKRGWLGGKKSNFSRIKFGKMPMCQMSPFLPQQKFYAFFPLKKLGQMITTVITHASGLPSFSPIQAKLYPIVKMGQWSLWVAMWYVQDTSGSETHMSNCSGIQICQPRHPTPIFSPTATPVLSEKIPTVILFSCHLCLHLPLAIYH